MSLTRKQIIIGASVLVGALVVGGISFATLTGTGSPKTTDIAAPREPSPDEKKDDSNGESPTDSKSPDGTPPRADGRDDGSDIIRLDGYGDPSRKRETNPVNKPQPEPEPQEEQSPPEVGAAPDPTKTGSNNNPGNGPAPKPPIPPTTDPKPPIPPTPTPTPTPDPDPEPAVKPDAVSAKNVSKFIVEYNTIRVKNNLKPLPVERFQVPEDSESLCWNEKNARHVQYMMGHMPTSPVPGYPDPHKDPCGDSEAVYQKGEVDQLEDSPYIGDGKYSASSWWYSLGHRLVIYEAPQTERDDVCLTFSSGYDSTPTSAGRINYAYSAVATWQACGFAGTIPAKEATKELDDYVLPEVGAGSTRNIVDLLMIPGLTEFAKAL